MLRKESENEKEKLDVGGADKRGRGGRDAEQPTRTNPHQQTNEPTRKSTAKGRKTTHTYKRRATIMSALW